MADPQAILRFLRDPNLQTGPYPQWPTMPPMQPGAELRNPAPRPADAMAPVAEALSPTMGAYGTGQIAADTALKAQHGDYAGLAANVPFIMGALKGPVRIPNPIKAYHGSPHDFNEFDLSKIGSGEGAQAYGHGLYFAENENVARQYRDDLAGAAYSNAFGPERMASELLASANGDYAKAATMGRQEAQKHLAIRSELTRSDPNYPDASAVFNKAADLLESGNFKPPGRMYEVALHATPEQFLDWDKPLREQSPNVRQNFGDVGGDLKMSELADLRSPQVADQLREAGIPGVRYLDQGSRPQGQGTHNYSIWSPEIIEILRKYGIIAAPTAGAIANAVAPPPQQ